MKKLERRLGLGSVISISMSAMMGSGIFVLPAVAASLTGASIWLAYLIAAVTVLPAALSKSELATAMPTSGGTYVYVERTFGPLAGTIAGLGLWLSLLLKSAFALVGFGAYLSIITDVSIRVAAGSFLLIIIVLNVLGVGKVSGVLVFVTVACVLGLTVISGYGGFQMDMNNFEPFLADGFSGLMAATALVYVSFAGVTKVAAIAEEIKNPDKNLPRGIMFSLFAVTGLYVLVSFVLVGNVPVSELSQTLRPIHLLGVKLGGEYAGYAVAVLGVLTMTAMANSGVLAASRFPFAMSRDQLLPKRLSRINKRFMTPVACILLSGILVGIAIYTLDVTRIAKLASAFQLTIYMVVNVTVIVLRENRVHWYQPKYKSLFYPWMQILGVVAGLVLLIGMGFLSVVGILTMGTLGALLYYSFAYKSVDRKGVLGIRWRRKDLEEVEPLPVIRVPRVEDIDFGSDARVVVSLFGKERSPEMVIEMGAALAQNEKLEVVHLTEVPEQTPLEDVSADTSEIRALDRRIGAMVKKNDVPIRFDPIVSHDMYKTIHEISQRLHCQWLVREWGGRTRGALTLHNPIGWLEDHLLCNLATFRDAGVRYIHKIMVLIKPDANNGLVLQTADVLANVINAEITLVKFVDKNLSDETVAQEKALLETMKHACKASVIHTMVLSGVDEVDTIVKTSSEFDLMVLGAAQRKPKWSRFFGSDRDMIMERVACSVLSVQPARFESTTRFLSIFN